MAKNTLGSKKAYKRRVGKCQICGETEYSVLSVHRIIGGKSGGTYSYSNVCCVCENHHRQIHAGQINVLGWVNSTIGRLLHVIYKNGEEDYIR